MKKNLKPVSNTKRARTHGFRKRMQTSGGQSALRRRRQRGRWKLIPD